MMNDCSLNLYCTLTDVIELISFALYFNDMAIFIIVTIYMLFSIICTLVDLAVFLT